MSLIALSIVNAAKPIWYSDYESIEDTRPLVYCSLAEVR